MRRPLRLAVALALPVLMAGCGGGDRDGPAPAPTPTSTPAPTETAAPPPTPSATPPDASFPIAAGAVPSAGVGAAWGADRWLVAFALEGGRGGPDVYGLRLDGDGASVDEAPLFLSELGTNPFLWPTTASYSGPSVAFDGTRFGVFFFGAGTAGGEEGPFGQIVGFTDVPPSGDAPIDATALVEQATFSLARTSLAPPVVAAGTEGRFVELHQRDLTLVGAFTFSDLPGNFVEVSAGGIDVLQTAATSVELPPPPEAMVLDASPAGVAFGAGRTLAAWVETYRDAAGSAAARLQGAWIAPQAAPVRIALADTTLGSQDVAIGSDGARFLVVWTATAPDGAATLAEVRGLHFTSDEQGGGTVDPPGGFPIAAGDAAKSSPSVAFGAGAYLVTWLEDGAVRGARVAPDAAPQSPFTIDEGPASAVAVASDGERFLATFVRVAGAAGELRGAFVPAGD